MQNAMCIETIDLGLRPYKEVWDLQHTIFNKMVAQKRQGNKPQKEYLKPLRRHCSAIIIRAANWR